ncbi:MAG: cytochrome c [Caldilineaceae bacterium]|nr:cytochrome c [Caldilineaceae bacterium]
MKSLIRRPSTLIFSLLIGLFALTACRMEMRTQPRLEAYEESTFFANGSALRQPVADTVARSQLHEDEFLQTGRVDGQIAASFPFTPTLATIERGQERFDIFCTPCHGIAGDGKGIITQYGMREPRSFHEPDLRAEAPGYYFNIITNGTRIMPSYAARIPPEDRWAIIAYIRALQLSQNADVNTLTPEDLSAIEGAE